MRRTLSRAAMAGAFISLITLAAYEAEARGGGGGARGGGSMSMSRGGGFGGGGGGGFNRGGGGGGGTFSRGGSYGGGGNRGNVNTGNVNRGNINTGNINTGNVNRGNINTGNVNVNRNVNVDVDNNWRGWGGYYDHPVGAGVAIGAAAAVTAAAIGSRYYALPPACSPYPYSGFTYYSCGGAYYKPTYQGDTVVYVVVAKP